MTKLIKSLGQIYEVSFLAHRDLNKIFSLKLPLWAHLFLLLTIFITIFISFVGFGYWLTGHTDLKYTIEGYPTKQEILLKKQLTEQIYALEKKIAYQDSLLRYLALPNSIPEEISSTFHEHQPQASQNLPPYRTKNQSILSKEPHFFSSVPENEKILQIIPPIRGLVSRGIRLNEQHYGVDIAVSSGQMVYAAHEGIVVLSEYSIQTGWVIVLMAPSGITTIYKHNQATLVQVGDKVNKGTPIAITGNLGQLSTGSHLHFEIWDRGKLIDPQKWMSLPHL